MRQCWLLVGMLWAGLVGAGHADYAAEWGPSVGSTLPVLEARDQDGNLRNLANLSGKRGFLLFLNRSADW